MPSIADLKKKTQALSIDKLKTHSDKGPRGDRFEDDRFWAPYFDKAKETGEAVIRFLPPHPEEDFPFLKFYRYGFKGPEGRWYLNLSRQSLDQPDPVVELWSRLRNSDYDSDKELSRQFSRGTKYVANVLIIKDPGNPENEGQVRIFQYGPMIHKMLIGAMEPEFEDETPINPFDAFEGANFMLRMHVTGGNRTYIKSKFAEPSPIGTDEEIEEIWSKVHPLKPLLAPERFKSYEELARQLYEVMGPEVGNGIPTITHGLEKSDEKQAEDPAPTPKPKPKKAEVEETTTKVVDEAPEDEELSDLDSEFDALFGD